MSMMLREPVANATPSRLKMTAELLAFIERRTTELEQ